MRFSEGTVLRRIEHGNVLYDVITGYILDGDWGAYLVTRYRADGNKVFENRLIGYPEIVEGYQMGNLEPVTDEEEKAFIPEVEET